MDTKNLKILSYNIRFGGRRRLDLLAQVLRSIRPDIAILQEATDPDVVKALAQSTGMPVWASRKGHSMGLLSHVTGLSWNWHKTSRSSQYFLEVLLQSPCLRIYGVHLRPRYFAWSEYYRVREIRDLLNLVNLEQDKEKPHILIGDFNAVAPRDEPRIERMPIWIRLLIHIAGGTIHTEAIDTLLQAGYMDAFRQLHTHRDGFTFPSFSPHIRFDYVFLPPRFPWKVQDCRAVASPPIVARASDHLPLLTVLAR